MDATPKTLEEKVENRDQKGEKKTKPLEDFDPNKAKAPKVEKPKPTPAVDPDADDPELGAAERAARSKRRKAKAAGQAAGLK